MRLHTAYFQPLVSCEEAFGQARATRKGTTRDMQHQSSASTRRYSCHPFLKTKTARLEPANQKTEVGQRPLSWYACSTLRNARVITTVGYFEELRFARLVSTRSLCIAQRRRRIVPARQT